MKVGDVVQLKSGGCNMTVLDVLPRYDYYTGDQFLEVTCVWHDDSYNPCRSDFDSKILKRGEEQ